MRKARSLMLLFSLAWILQAQELTLLVPNGGETLVCGTPLFITWSSDGLSGNEAVLLSLEGVADFGPVARSTAGAGALEWPAGMKMDGTFAKPGAGYRISIRLLENDSVFDQSDESFTLAAPASVVSLLAPNGGETLAAGNDFNIDWACAGTGGIVSLSLLKGDLELGAIAENLPAARLRCRWRVGAPLLNGAAYGAGADYRVRIRWRAGETLEAGQGLRPGESAASLEAGTLAENSDDSDSAFVITDPGRESRQ